MTAPPEQPARQVAGLMRVRGIRHVLVMDGERLAGIVSSRDLRTVTAGEESLPTADCPVSRLMSENPVTVSPEVPLTAAARAMLDRKIGALPVVDGNRVVGILTKSDSLEALLAWVERGGGATD